MHTPKKKRANTDNGTKDTGNLATELVNVARDMRRPDNTLYRSLSFQDELGLVQSTGHTHKEIQRTALENDIVPERYARNRNSLSFEEQLRLLKTHVAIIGLGGLGGTVTEILSRIGIGTLTLVDGDRFEDSNLNRQLLSSTEVLGQMKADVATARVAALNPAVEIHQVNDFFRADNSSVILGGVDIAVDCLDTIPDRFVLEDGCRAAGIPMVSAAIGGTSGQVTVIFPGDLGLRRIYGSPDTVRPKGVETSLGTLPYAAIAMAAMECAEIVALAAGRPAHLRNRLLHADFTFHSMESVQLD